MRCDVCVLSFADASETTVARLSELCALPIEEARRFVHSAPAVLQRGLAPAQATALERDLRALGAEVVVQASAEPGPEPLRSEPLVVPMASAPPALDASTPPVASGPPVAPYYPPSARPGLPPLQPPGSGATPSPRVPRRVLILGGAALSVGALWWWWRTPRVGALAVHARGSSSDQAPTLVLLHGYGAPGDDLVGLGEEVTRAVGEKAVRCLMPEGGHRVGLGRAWWTNTGQLNEARAAIGSVIQELIEDGTPSSRIILGGFSQGAMMAMDVGLSFRPRLYGVAMMSGGNLPGVDWSAQVDSVETTRFLITHGQRDSVTPFSASEKLSERLRAAGADVRFLPFQGSHAIPPPAREALATFVAELAQRS